MMGEKGKERETALEGQRKGEGKEKMRGEGKGRKGKRKGADRRE